MQEAGAALRLFTLLDGCEGTPGCEDRYGINPLLLICDACTSLCVECSIGHFVWV